MILEMAEKKQRFVHLNDRELIFYLLRLKRNWAEDEFAKTTLEKKGEEEETLAIITEIEKDFGLDGRGSLEARLEGLINFLCAENSFILEEIEAQLTEQIQKGVVSPFILDELQEKLTVFERELKAINLIAKEIAQRQTRLSSEFIARLLRNEIFRLQNSGEIKDFSVDFQSVKAKAGEEKAIALNIRKALGKQIGAIEQLTDKFINQEEALKKVAETVQKEYGLSAQRAQETVKTAIAREEQTLKDKLLEVKGVSPIILKGVTAFSAGLILSAVPESIPSDPKITPRLDAPKDFEKKVKTFLKQARVPSHQIRLIMPRLKTAFKPSLWRIRTEVNREIIHSALKEVAQKLGLKKRESEVLQKEGAPVLGADSPSLKMLATETVLVVAQEANPQTVADNSTINHWAAVVTERVRPAFPEIKFEEAREVLRGAFQLGEESKGAQIALQRIILDSPSEIKEVFAQEKDELFLKGLGTSLGVDLIADEQLANLPHFLQVGEIKASLYQLPVRKEQIPDQVLTFLKEDLGDKETYLYEEIVRVLNGEKRGEIFTPERLEAIWPLIDDQGRLSVRGILELKQASEIQKTGELSRLREWYELLSEEQKGKLGWLKNVLDKKSEIFRAIENSPFYRFRQRFLRLKNDFWRPVGNWAVRTISFGRFPTISAAAGAFKNWFFQTGFGQAVKTAGAKVSQKAAEWALKTGAKKLLSSAAGKAIAAGLSAILGISTAGLGFLIQAAIMVGGWLLKKAGQLGKKILGSLGIDTDKLRQTFGFLGGLAAKALETTVGIVGGLLKAPIEAGKLASIGVLAVIGVVVFPALLAFSTFGSAQRISMEERGYPLAELGGELLTQEELDTLNRGQLPLELQKALINCGITKVSSRNLDSVENCLSGRFSEKAFAALKYSAESFGYLQCVGFVVATVPDFPGGGDAFIFTNDPPDGWHKTASQNAQIGDLAVWGPSASCRGDCSTDISCCGHIGVITGVEITEEGTDYLVVTSANGSNGQIITLKIPIDNPAVILTRD